GQWRPHPRGRVGGGGGGGGGACASPATIVASVSDPADTALLEDLVARAATPIHLITLTQDGTGKRRALVDALEKLRSMRLPRGCIVALMDGDTWLPPGALAATVPFLPI